MSARKGRAARVLAAPQDERQLQKGSSVENMKSPNLSVIDKDSFLEGLQLNYGNPLHSTAVEEDLFVSEEKAGKKDFPQTVKQRGPAVKRKERDGENEEEEEEKKKRNRKSTGGMVKTRPEKEEGTMKKGALQGKRGKLNGESEESDQSSIPQKNNNNKKTPTTISVKHLVGKRPAKRRSAGQTTARQVKNQQMKKDRKRESEPESEKSSGPQSEEESDTDTPQQTRNTVLSSDDEELHSSWKPSPKKAKAHSLFRTRKSSSDRSKSRKSSSGSASAGSQTTNTNKQKKKKSHGGTELEVVLDAFLDFCEQYSESVESKAVKQSIDSFSSNVKDQLLEKISSNKELKSLKRENAKVGSLIREKTQRLLEAKHELVSAERQVYLMQKEKAELKLRLADLKRGQAFLQDIGQLNEKYLDHRRKHPKEKETYGASSLPALLLETKHVQTTEQQLKRINDRLDRRLKTKWK